jgi:hypothetical protein
MKAGTRWAIVVSVLIAMTTPSRAVSDGAFILNSFPACKGKPVFSPYPSGAIDGLTAEKRANWYAHAKPIVGAPCVLNLYNNPAAPIPAWCRAQENECVIFCDKTECRTLGIQ